jgi:hypothetical protein
LPRPPGDFIVPAAGCTVSLRSAEWVAGGFEPEHTFVFFFPHFPRDPAPQFRWGGVVVTGTRDAEGVIHVIIPEKR